MKIEYIKDITNNNFLGINIYTEKINHFLQKMKNILGEEYDEFVKYQQDRDRGHYHCTVLNVADYNKVIKNMEYVNYIYDFISKSDIDDFKMLGIGNVEWKGNRAYFIVCKSEKLKIFRSSLKLENIDFHITIGFKYKDVHGLRKNVVIPDVDPFVTTLKQYYFDFDNSFSFLKELDNFNFDKSKEIFCTKITDTYAEFKIGNEEGIVDRFTVAIIGNKLSLSCKWQTRSNDAPYLADTLILRKFK